jgi:hypothetical protein
LDSQKKIKPGRLCILPKNKRPERFPVPALPLMLISASIDGYTKRIVHSLFDNHGKTKSKTKKPAMPVDRQHSAADLMDMLLK